MASPPKKSAVVELRASAEPYAERGPEGEEVDSIQGGEVRSVMGEWSESESEESVVGVEVRVWPAT